MEQSLDKELNKESSLDKDQSSMNGEAKHSEDQSSMDGEAMHSKECRSKCLKHNKSPENESPDQESAKYESMSIDCGDGVCIEYGIETSEDKSSIVYITFKFKLLDMKLNVTYDDISFSSSMEWKNVVKAIKHNKYGAIDFCNRNDCLEVKGDHVKFSVAKWGSKGSCQIKATVPSSKCLQAFKEIASLMKKYH